MYDILFVSGSYREALKNRPGYYVALAVTWIPLVALVFLVGTHGGTVGTGLGMSSVQYAATQFGVISKYLTLSFWPSPLIVDYESEVARGAAQIIPYAFIVISLVIGTAYAIRNVSWLGFLGFWFFAILAPTSSVLPVVSQTMAEHRMYLPLAAVTALVVICGESLCHRLLTLFAIPVEDRRFLSRWVPIFILAIVAWALLSLTIARNRDYSSELVLWRDTIEKRPTNSRAHSNYGVALIESGKIDLAFEQFTKALELDPKNADAVTNIGGILASQGRGSEAIPFLEDGLRYRPKNAGAHTNLGSVLAALGRFDEAIEHYRASLKIDPLHAETHNNLGNALLRNGKIDDAISELRRARELKPDSDQIRLNLQTALDQKLKSE